MFLRKRLCIFFSSMSRSLRPKGAFGRAVVKTSFAILVLGGKTGNKTKWKTSVENLATLESVFCFGLSFWRVSNQERSRDSFSVEPVGAEKCFGSSFKTDSSFSSDEADPIRGWAEAPKWVIFRDKKRRERRKKFESDRRRKVRQVKTWLDYLSSFLSDSISKRVKCFFLQQYDNYHPATFRVLENWKLELKKHDKSQLNLKQLWIVIDIASRIIIS